jgi:hypothetical protein
MFGVNYRIVSVICIAGTLFNVEELLAGANELGVGRTVKIHQKGIFLECTGDVILEDKYVVPRVGQRFCDSKIICELCRSYAVQATRESDKALNFKLFRYIEGDADSDSGGGSGGGAKGMNLAGIVSASILYDWYG